MNAWTKSWGFLAGLSGAAGVGLGAYGAHALSGVGADYVDLASRYALIHALALAVVAVLERRQPRPTLHLAGLFFTLGIAGFSGSLVARVVFSLSHVPTTPLGGTCLILGWLTLGLAFLGEGRGR